MWSAMGIAWPFSEQNQTDTGSREPDGNDQEQKKWSN
jgi:hypothetical protein